MHLLTAAAVAMLVVAACGNGSPAATPVVGQLDEAALTATFPPEPEETSAPAAVGPAITVRSQAQTTPVAEAPTVADPPKEAPTQEAPAPTSIPVASASEDDVQLTVEETEVTLDLASDPRAIAYWLESRPLST